MTDSPYELSAAARLDLLQIWNYLAENASLDVADKVLNDIENAIVRLTAAPGHGHRRVDLTDRDLRFDRVHSYLIAYRPRTRPLSIVRVIHASRDVKRLLDQ